LQFQTQEPEFCPSQVTLKSFIGFVLLVPTSGPESQLLVRGIEADSCEGKETLIALQINNNFSYITSLFQHKALQSDAAHITVLF